MPLFDMDYTTSYGRSGTIEITAQDPDDAFVVIYKELELGPEEEFLKLECLGPLLDPLTEARLEDEARGLQNPEG